MKTLRPGHAIVEALRAEEVEVIFGLPGGHILGVYDGLYDAPEIRHVLVRHEHAAASMAAGYAQLTGKPGVCLVTAGPGATNLVTAVAEAYVGALPVVILAARASTVNAHRGAPVPLECELPGSGLVSFHPRRYSLDRMRCRPGRRASFLRRPVHVADP